MTHPLSAELRGRAIDCECVFCREMLNRAADALDDIQQQSEIRKGFYDAMEKDWNEAKDRIKVLEKALIRISEFTPDLLPSLKLESCIDLARAALGEMEAGL